jgi:hypothetical protein
MSAQQRAEPARNREHDIVRLLAAMGDRGHRVPPPPAAVRDETAPPATS